MSRHHTDPGSLMTVYRAALTAGAQASRLDSMSDECQVRSLFTRLLILLLLSSLFGFRGVTEISVAAMVDLRLLDCGCPSFLDLNPLSILAALSH